MSGARAFARIALGLAGAASLFLVTELNTSVIIHGLIGDLAQSPRAAEVGLTFVTVVSATVAVAWIVFAFWCAFGTPPRLAGSGAWRGGVLVLALAWGWYFLSSFRTAGFGLTPLGAAGLLLGVGPAVLPLGWAACATMPPARRGVVLLVAAVSVLAGTEAWARAQEAAVLRRFGSSPPEGVVVARWPPFAHHGMSFAQGRWQGSD